jgi:cell wall-associated NlpC family hydrolase
MKQLQPRGLNRRRVEQLLSKTKQLKSIGDRIEALSRNFIGRPYTQNPLVGSADTPEVFVASLDGFDCVTLVETVLALARARRVDDFAAELRKIRYKDGSFQWNQRNHYTTVWIFNNIAERIVMLLAIRGVPAITRKRLLNVVPGLMPVRASLRCVPKRAVPRLESHLQTGDVIFFVSTKKNLDVFHWGIIVRNGAALRMRHASRSAKRVVEQELKDFLKANRMAGVMVARPREMK